MVKKSIKKNRKKFILIFIVAFIIIILSIFITLSSLKGSYYKKVDLDLYVMSKCPYGIEVEQTIEPLLSKFRDSLNLNINFIASESSGNFNSLHGQTEVDGDIIQLCTMKYNPDIYFNLISCMNDNPSEIPLNWEGCAQKNNININKIKTCFSSYEGKNLLSESIKKSDNIGAQGSPTIYLNNKQYTGARDTLSFTRAICSNLNNHPECSSIPECISDNECTAHPLKDGICQNSGLKDAKCVYEEPLIFEVIILNDNACSDCITAPIENGIKNLFKGANFRTVDISSDEGKVLIESNNVVFIPTYLFDKEIVNTYTWKKDSRVSSIFENKNEYYKLSDESTGANHFVNKELKKQYLDSIGIKTGDNRPQIDFYVMSFCPYGNEAETAIEPVYQLLKNKADFNPRYVIYSNFNGGGSQYCIDSENKYCSMHGIMEMNQNIRELCVEDIYGLDKWFEFALDINSKCNSNNAASCWNNVAISNGIDINKINSCFSSKSEIFASKELRLNNLMGVSGSPTVFIDGMEFNGARNPESYKQALCSEFENQPIECNTILKGKIQQTQNNTNLGSACGI